jgi:hypothetical protein
LIIYFQLATQFGYLDKIHDAIRHQANLIELDLSKAVRINDKTLAVIGSTCEHLT